VKKYSPLRRKQLREFSKLDAKYVKNNYLKDFIRTSRELGREYGVTSNQVQFALWAYDLEFFTIDHAIKGIGRAKSTINKRYIYPMKKMGLVYKPFEQLDISSDGLFQETQALYKHAAKFSLTQKGMIMVERMYRGILHP
jgi:hypothetical protein